MKAIFVAAISALFIGCVGCSKAPRQANDAGAIPASEVGAAFESMVAPEGVAVTAPDEGIGPGQGGDKHDRIIDNPFLRVSEQPLSTFSIDVDTASYSKIRQYLTQYHQMPRPDAVRIEELLNYFHYNYESPASERAGPFATHASVSECPWNDQHRLVRLALKGREIEREVRPTSNLVLLIDSSGSMNAPNKLPLLKEGMRLLLEQLGASDRVAIVAYAGSAGMVLDSTPADQSSDILGALDRLDAGGSTNGGQGLQLAYQVARDHFVADGTNRILLCTDGDFNVGASGTDQLVRMVEQESKGGIELTVLGFGMGNLNDAMLEQISGRGNGNYAFIDTLAEANKVLVEQLSGTLVTIAKDVKIQVEFNPAVVAAYRLIGYENRVLDDQDFNDDKKDAGEIGAGHTVTALYEVVPIGAATAENLPETDPLKYQEPAKQSAAAQSGEMLTLKLRYKLPGQDESTLREQVVLDSGARFQQADEDLQFAAAVAGFGMLLRDSEHRGDWDYDAVKRVAKASIGPDPHGFREEFVQLVSIAQELDPRQ